MLFVGLFDEVMGDEGIRDHRRDLLAVFQDSALRLVRLVRPVVDANDGGTGPPAAETPQDGGRLVTESPASSGTLESQQVLAAQGDSPAAAAADDRSPACDWPADTTRPPGHARATLPDVKTTFIYNWMPTQEARHPATVTWTLDSFCVQLLEATLSQACLVLAGQLPVPPEELDRAFGAILRHRTREQLLAYLRWLLGSDLRQKHIAAGVAPSLFLRTSPPSPPYLDAFGLESNVCGDPGAHGVPPGFLTAAGVQDQLRGLGAKVLGPDALELRINGGTLTLHINVSVLMSKLADSAICSTTGPAYSQSSFSQAVEASLMSVYDESNAATA